DRLDPRLTPMPVDEGDHHFGRRSSSAWAKKAAAWRSISLARFNSRLSRSSSFRRSRSELVRPARLPPLRLGLPDPLAQGLCSAPDLARDRDDCCPLRLVLSLVLKDQPDCAFPNFR